MIDPSQYIFTSRRLGFRNWIESDRPKMLEISSDPRVMKFFPALLDKKSNDVFIDRMLDMFDKQGFCYFAVDLLSTGEFIGFIGLAQQTFESDFTPCIDIGYRLKSSSWNQGYATEGAARCLKYAFKHLRLQQVLAVAVEINQPSIGVMKKIGMRKLKSFIHPEIKDNPRLKRCVLYAINRS